MASQFLSIVTDLFELGGDRLKSVGFYFGRYVGDYFKASGGRQKVIDLCSIGVCNG